jgi:hypothetical protein
VQSTIGKSELASMCDDTPRAGRRPAADRRLHNTFARRVDLDALDDVVLAFETGLVVETASPDVRRATTCVVREPPGW